MQTLWSRAAPPQSLCISSNSISTTRLAARRSTTATPKRKLPVGNAFTVFASSLAATASYVDSRIKDARRAQWDLVINEARAQVQATEAQQQKRLASLGLTVEEETLEQQRAGQWGAVSDASLDNVVSGHQRPAGTNFDTWVDVFGWAKQQDEARAASGFSDWKGPSLSLLQALPPELLQDLLSDCRKLRRFYGGQDYAALVDETITNDLTPKKLRTLEYSIAKLVLKLLVNSCNTTHGTESTGGDLQSTHAAVDGGLRPEKQSAVAALDQSPSMANPSEDSLTNHRRDPEAEFLQDLIQNEDYTNQRLADLDAHIKTLHRSAVHARSKFFEDYESPSHPKYHAEFTGKLHQEQALNNSLDELLESIITPEDCTLSITKICYNLLASKTPPNIHSYNMLLVRFCQMDSKDMVEAVVASMRESHIRPNEITHSTLLRYYTRKPSPAQFTGYYLRMMGYNHGLALASPSQDISPDAIHRYRFFGPNNRLAVELARMNAEVYEALIVGALQFFGSQAAIQFYRDMVNEGWKSSVDLLTAILKHCACRFDWESGAAVWEQIKRKATGAHRVSYELMLSLCQACGQHAAFDQILRSGMDEGVLPSDMEELPEQIKHQLDSIQKARGEEVKGWKILKARRKEKKKLIAIEKNKMKHESELSILKLNQDPGEDNMERDRSVTMTDIKEKPQERTGQEDQADARKSRNAYSHKKSSSLIRQDQISTRGIALLGSLIANESLSTQLPVHVV